MNTKKSRIRARSRARSQKNKIYRKTGGEDLSTNYNTACSTIPNNVTETYKDNTGTIKKRIKWPNSQKFPDGCDPTTRKEILLPPDTLFDRFGSETGTFGGLLVENDTHFYPYTMRSIPYIALTNNKGTSCNKFYNKQFKNEFNKINFTKIKYNVYKVLKEINVIQCKAAPFGKYPGGAVQVKFDRPISKLLADEIIEKVNGPYIIPTFE